ncbi:MAG: adenylyltransferase/cytidyltransferase family protein [Limnospira sp.]
MPNDLYSLASITEAIARNPERWRPLVFTNGCFDLIHAGHVRYLTRAKSLGRSLVVGLNSDRSVRAIKPPRPGYPPRPIVPEWQRAEVLGALKPVDGVVIFDDRTASHLIETLKPDIYVKGGDYTRSTLPETPAVQACGGRIQFVTVEIPSSTSGIVERILGKSKR